VRLFTLLLTLLILWIAGYFGGSSLFRQEWTEVYWIFLTALGALTTCSTFFLGQTFGRFDKLTDFPLDSLQQAAFHRKLAKRRNRLLVKWCVGLVSGILAIVFSNVLKIVKISVIAGSAAAFTVISLACLILIIIEFIVLSNLLARLKERSDHQSKKQAFLSRSEI
jgi:hypothetical protein